MIDDNGLSEAEKLKEELKLQIRQLFDEVELKATDPTLALQMEGQRRATIEALVTEIGSNVRSPETRADVKKYHEMLVLAADQHRSDQPESIIADIKIIISEAKLRYEVGDLDYALEILDGEESGIIILAQTDADLSEGLAELCLKLEKLINLLYGLRGQ